METPILHHYDPSPYSEKIRLIFGMKRLAWSSVQMPLVMPKPDLTALTGGYRRAPVLQIGADIYCDTRTIARALDRIAPEPPLYRPHTAAVDAGLTLLAEEMIMAVVLIFLLGGEGLPEEWGARVPPEELFEDRKKMAPGGFDVEEEVALLPTRRDQVRMSLSVLEDQLGNGHSHLLGDEASYADFSLYTPVWFLSAHPLTGQVIAAFPRVVAWRDRMAAFGHGERSEMDAAEAIEIARRSTSSTEPSEDAGDPNGRKPGDQVRVMPKDYGLDPVEGELVDSDAYEIAIRRTDDRAGEVVVHFPRQGYLTLPGA